MAEGGDVVEGGNEDKTARLKSALWFSIGQIVDEETINLGVNASPQFIGALTELVWAQIENTSIDMETFARHANRTTILPSDILLLARRNEGLEKILRAHLRNLSSTTNTTTETSGKKPSGSTSGPGSSKALQAQKRNITNTTTASGKRLEKRDDANEDEDEIETRGLMRSKYRKSHGDTAGNSNSNSNSKRRRSDF